MAFPSSVHHFNLAYHTLYSLTEIQYKKAPDSPIDKGSHTICLHHITELQQPTNLPNLHQSLSKMRSFARIHPARRVVICQRPFSLSPQSCLKEDKPQTPQQIEKAKQQQVGKDGKKKEDLQSSSETIVKAEKSDKGPEELQKETAKQAQREHEGGKS